MDEFLQLRIELDRAITFGRDVEALAIAQNGLAAAKAKNLPAEAEYFRAQFFILDEDFLAAITHLNKAVELNPHDGAAFNDKALCLAELGKLDEALSNFDQGILAEPDYATIYHNKGWLLNKLGRFHEAIECFNKALELEPERPVTYENLGDVYLNLGLKNNARQAYQNALKCLPDDCETIKEQLEKLIREVSL
jgi:Flp pilus assembly protein TadD